MVTRHMRPSCSLGFAQLRHRHDPEFASMVSSSKNHAHQPRLLHQIWPIKAATPGNVFPSIISNEAPPPVEMCEILSAT